MSGYAKNVLVDANWLSEHLNDDSIRIIEVDENPALYAEAHIPGAPSLPSSCETASAVGLLSLRARTDVLWCRSSHQRWKPGRGRMTRVEERREA